MTTWDQRMGLGRGVEHGLSDPNRQRILPPDPVRQVVRRVHKPGCFMHLGHEVDGQRFFRREDLPRQEDLLGHGLEVRRVGWDDKQPVFRPIRHAWRSRSPTGVSAAPAAW